MNEEITKTEKVFHYVWGWIMLPFRGAIGALINTMFRVVFALLIPIMVPEVQVEDTQRFAIMYAIIASVWMMQPIMRLINSRIEDFRWRKYYNMEEKEK